MFRYDRKLEQEIKDYNPFGKSGGGAPIKDASGQAIGKSDSETGKECIWW